jgi:hypothetical protein
MRIVADTNEALEEAARDCVEFELDARVFVELNASEMVDLSFMDFLIHLL